MRAPISLLKIICFAVALAAPWIGSAAPAWAGGGGESGISLQGVLDDICSLFATGPCPQLPTVTQQVLEIAGLTNEAPDIVRTINSVCTPPGCPQVAVNAVNGLAKSPPAHAGSEGALWYVTPLAFTTGAGATQYGDPAAKSFFYATVLAGANGQPRTLDLFYDYTPGRTRSAAGGRIPVSLSLPLVVLSSNGSERPVSATLTASCIGFGPCHAAISGDFLGTGKTKTYGADALGVGFDFDFKPSPNSPAAHPVVEVQLPLVVTMKNDPAYFTTAPCPTGVNPISGYCEAFTEDVTGFRARVLGAGASVGVAPYAAPPCTAATCPANPPATPPTTYFGFCASFSHNPAIAAFASVGTDGASYASSPVSGQGVTLPQCPAENRVAGAN